ncbi:MAG: hypothetical protein ACYC27_09140 [Armatimonadota bacterium]
MYLKPVFIIMMTVGLMFILSGCGRQDSAWIDPPVLNRPHIAAIGKSVRNEAAVYRLSDVRNSIANHDMSILDKHDNHTQNRSDITAEIAVRILRQVDDWNSYRIDLASGDMNRGQAVEPEKPLPLELPDQHVESEEVFIPVYSDSTEYLNWKIRVALLESRLSVASNESEKKIIQEKLDQAIIALKDAEGVFRKPIQADSVDIVPQIVKQPVYTETAVRDVDAGKKIVRADHEDHRISNSLDILNKRVNLATDSKLRNKRESSAGTAFTKIRTETIAGIEKLILQLQTGQASGTHKSLKL